MKTILAVLLCLFALSAVAWGDFNAERLAADDLIAKEPRDWAGALAAYQKLFADYPKMADTWKFTLKQKSAGCHEQLREYPEAVADLLEARASALAGGHSPYSASVSLVRVYDKMKDATKASEAAMAALGEATDPTAIKALLERVLPANDATRLSSSTAQEAINSLTVYLRKERTPEIDKVLATAAKQLTEGGTDRPFTVTQSAKDLAVELKDAKLAGYLVPLLNGDYRAAIVYAHAQAAAAGKDADYLKWVNATSAAIRGLDQCYNKRALDYLKWCNGALEKNPVEDLVKEP